MSVTVNSDNFVRAESARMFHDLQRDAGGINTLLHNRQPASIDKQTVIRMNRDTLYSFADIAAVAALQDQIALESRSAEPFAIADYDQVSFDETRNALLMLAKNLTGYDRMFGPIDEIDPVRHLIGTAAGWGGLPTSGAYYSGASPDLPAGNHELTVHEVPVDGFWSISVYNAAGYFAPNDRGIYTVNSVTGTRNEDGSITVRFGDYPADVPNAIPTPEGWNYLVRLYRPRPEVVNGTWGFPRLG